MHDVYVFAAALTAFALTYGLLVLCDRLGSHRGSR